MYALVAFPAANGFRELAVPLANADYDGWRIDVPDGEQAAGRRRPSGEHGQSPRP